MHLRLFPFLILAVFLSACAKAPPKTAAVVSLPRFQSLSSFVQVRVNAKGKMESFDAALLIRTPDKLRIEIMDDLGQVVSRIVANGSQVLWHRPVDQEYMLLPQDEKTLKKTLRLPLSIASFIQGMLLGDLPPEAKGYRVSYQAQSSTRGAYPETIVWEFTKPKATLHLVMLEPETQLPPEPEKFDTAPPLGARATKFH